MRERGGRKRGGRNGESPNEWAPVQLWHRGALGFFVSAKRCLAHVSWCTRSTWHVAFAPSILRLCSNCRRHNAGLAAVLTSPCAVTLQSKVACLSRWHHAPLQEWADGPLSAFLPAVRCLPVGNSCGAGSRCFATATGAAHGKCCARYRKVSSWALDRFPLFLRS